jgi:hypothetical protein
MWYCGPLLYGPASLGEMRDLEEKRGKEKEKQEGEPWPL